MDMNKSNRQRANGGDFPLARVCNACPYHVVRYMGSNLNAKVQKAGSRNKAVIKEIKQLKMRARYTAQKVGTKSKTAKKVPGNTVARIRQASDKLQVRPGKLMSEKCLS